MVKGLERRADDFQVQDENKNICTVRWQFQPTIPVNRASGVFGWALLDGVFGRVHVCACDPCIAKHPASKYGVIPMPVHVRLLKEGAASVALFASGSDVASFAASSGAASSSASLAPSSAAAAPATPAVVGPEPAVPDVADAAAADAVPESPELSPAAAGPEALHVPPPSLPPTPQPSPPSRPSPNALLCLPLSLTPSPPPRPPSSSHPTASPAVAGPAPEIVESRLLDKSVVAPPPLPPPSGSGTLPEVVPPPERAALLPVPIDKPCPPVEASSVPPKTIVKLPAVAGAEDDGDEALPVGELYSESVAQGMNTVIVDLAKAGAYVGTSAFLIFALKYRVRVRVWYDQRCEDLLAVHAPWATNAISNHAFCDAVACRLRQYGELESINDDSRNTNHWVAAYYAAGGHVQSLGEDGPDLSLGEGASDVTTEFYGIYLSLSLHIALTVMDGDCGLDVMCLMLAWKRCKMNRCLLRRELSAFALKHLGNRAFVAMLYGVGELRTHLGLFELDSAGATLFADETQEAVQELHHGDGAAPAVVPQSPDARARHFSDEEIRAMTWKCRLQKASPEFIVDMLQRLPEECIKENTTSFRKFQIVEAKESQAVQQPFIISRDTRLVHKWKAAESFLHFCRETHGALTPKDIHLLQSGRIPRGWFIEYVKNHFQLRKACDIVQRKVFGNHSYINVLKMYRRAVQRVLSTDSAVAEQLTSAVSEQEASADVEHAEDDGFGKFSNKAPRIGRQYFSSTWNFKRDSERRRTHGGGRTKSCVVLREELMIWYGIVRHSVDTKIMCRFPKKVLLVKAKSLQQDY